MKDIFDEMQIIQRKMDNMFNEFFGSPELKMIGKSKKKGKRLTRMKQPLSDVIDTGKEIIAKLELPGIEKKDVRLNITRNMVEVNAEKKHEAEVEKKGIYRSERSYSGFYRTLPFPAEVDPNKAKAKMKDGLLEIIAPKIKQMTKSKQLQIE